MGNEARMGCEPNGNESFLVTFFSLQQLVESHGKSSQTGSVFRAECVFITEGHDWNDPT
jgi:hypothetical protein